MVTCVTVQDNLLERCNMDCKSQTGKPLASLWPDCLAWNMQMQSVVDVRLSKKKGSPERAH